MTQQHWKDFQQKHQKNLQKKGEPQILAVPGGQGRVVWAGVWVSLSALQIQNSLQKRIRRLPQVGPLCSFLFYFLKRPALKQICLRQ